MITMKMICWMSEGGLHGEQCELLLFWDKKGILPLFENRRRIDVIHKLNSSKYPYLEEAR